MEVSAKKAIAGSIIDSICTIIFVLVFFNLDLNTSNLISSMAIAGAIVPDILIGFHEIAYPNPPKILRLIHRWHFKNHDLIAAKFDFSLKKGRMMQVVLFLILMKLL